MLGRRQTLYPALTFDTTPPSMTPTVASVSPDHGAPLTAFTLTGTHLEGATSVKIGGKTCAFTQLSPNKLSCVSPIGTDLSAPGGYNVVVVSPQGTATLTNGWAIPATDPKSFSNCTLWLRGDLGVTLTSGKVSTWADQSGGGFDLTQGTAGNRPTQVAAALGGKTVVRFDGVDDFIQATATLADILTATAFTIFYVFKATAAHDDGTPYGSGPLLADNPSHYF